MTQRVLSPAERAMLFNQHTRQHIISLPTRPLLPSSTIEYELPKVRLTSRILLEVHGTITLGGTGTATATPWRAARYIRNLRVNINNGFNPFQISGRGLFLYNCLLNSGIGETVDEQNVLGVTRASTVPFRVYLEVPLTLNQRETMGLINTSNPQTTVNLVIDSDTLASLYTTAETFTGSDIRVTPHIESFSIPQHADAIPDLSVLKLVHEFSQTIPAAGDVTFDLQTGLVYRKIIASYEDVTGNIGMAVTALGPLQLILNQADFPYIMAPQLVRDLNHKSYSQLLPAGVFVWDFTGGSQPNYGNARDYIDTERLTEFWLRTTTTNTGRLTVITETLARLGM